MEPKIEEVIIGGLSVTAPCAIVSTCQFDKSLRKVTELLEVITVLRKSVLSISFCPHLKLVTSSGGHYCTCCDEWNKYVTNKFKDYEDIQKQYYKWMLKVNKTIIDIHSLQIKCLQKENISPLINELEKMFVELKTPLLTPLPEEMNEEKLLSYTATFKNLIADNKLMLENILAKLKAKNELDWDEKSVRKWRSSSKTSITSDKSLPFLSYKALSQITENVYPKITKARSEQISLQPTRDMLEVEFQSKIISTLKETPTVEKAMMAIMQKLTAAGALKTSSKQATQIAQKIINKGLLEIMIHHLKDTIKHFSERGILAVTEKSMKTMLNNFTKRDLISPTDAEVECIIKMLVREGVVIGGKKDIKNIIQKLANQGVVITAQENVEKVVRKLAEEGFILSPDRALAAAANLQFEQKIPNLSFINRTLYEKMRHKPAKIQEDILFIHGSKKHIQSSPNLKSVTSSKSLDEFSKDELFDSKSTKKKPEKGITSTLNLERGKEMLSSRNSSKKSPTSKKTASDTDDNKKEKNKIKTNSEARHKDDKYALKTVQRSADKDKGRGNAKGSDDNKNELNTDQRSAGKEKSDRSNDKGSDENDIDKHKIESRNDTGSKNDKHTKETNKRSDGEDKDDKRNDKLKSNAKSTSEGSTIEKNYTELEAKSKKVKNGKKSFDLPTSDKKDKFLVNDKEVGKNDKVALKGKDKGEKAKVKDIIGTDKASQSESKNNEDIDKDDIEQQIGPKSINKENKKVEKHKKGRKKYIKKGDQDESVRDELNKKPPKPSSSAKLFNQLLKQKLNEKKKKEKSASKRLTKIGATEGKLSQKRIYKEGITLPKIGESKRSRSMSILKEPLDLTLIPKDRKKEMFRSVTEMIKGSKIKPFHKIYLSSDTPEQVPPLLFKVDKEFPRDDLLLTDESRLSPTSTPKEWRSKGIRVNSLHPGNMVFSNISKSWWFWRLAFFIVRPFTKSLEYNADYRQPLQTRKTRSKTGKGILKYALSEPAFINNGYTILPSVQIMRKINIYKMEPSKPESNWFLKHKHKKMLFYKSGERFAMIDSDGYGTWYYKNGILALNYYAAEEHMAKKRYVIYSSGEDDANGNPRPLTVLAIFDQIGSGVVYDHFGNERLKFNQSEGQILDKTIGSIGRWKWNSLNDNHPVYPVYMDIPSKYEDLGPELDRLMRMNKSKTAIKQKSVRRLDAEEALLKVELSNYVKEKENCVLQSIDSFEVKYKVFKINEQFSLHIISQSTIYIQFREGDISERVNIGMKLQSNEILDTDSCLAEIQVMTPYDRTIPRSDSVANMRQIINSVRKQTRIKAQYQSKLRG